GRTGAGGPRGAAGRPGRAARPRRPAGGLLRPHPAAAADRDPRSARLPGQGPGCGHGADAQHRHPGAGLAATQRAGGQGPRRPAEQVDAVRRRRARAAAPPRCPALQPAPAAL
ncbi:MAG: hypothetical protein AVDCRST_MAG61-460, partial [uncultured Friedmanniella sp.]